MERMIGRKFFLGIRYKDINNWCSVYISYSRRRVGVEQMKNGVLSYMEYPYTFTVGTPYLLAANVKSGRVQVSVNGIPQFTWSLPDWTTVGKIGLSTDFAFAHFDDLIISDAYFPNTSLFGLNSITAGNYHTCESFANNVVRCWGVNAFGQLGNGTLSNSSTPVAVSGVSNVLAITAGGSHTCALLLDQTVKCWGFNFYGQLGDGTTNNSSVPVAVVGLSNVVAVSAGGNHTCALLSDSTLKCWGNNVYGQLGNGSTTTSSRAVTVMGISNAGTITAGGFHACTRLWDSTLKCWGNNAFGELGNISTTSSSTPVVVQNGNSGNATATGAAVSAGGYHTCTLLGGWVYCWGAN